jgi:beta-galactosidase
MRARLLAAAAALAVAAAADNVLTITLAPPPPPVAIPPMGTPTSPSGTTVGFDSQSLLLNGSRWLAVGGEFHYARVPAAEWRDELLKVKAAGVTTVSVYVFWLHHQEAAGASWDWEGQRSLRNFTRTVGDVGLKMLLRAGPWSHGEARSGGFPDWLVAVPGIQLRSNTSVFMGYVGELYAQIAGQVADLTWGKGGPIIGMQLDNEYGSSAG